MKTPTMIKTGLAGLVTCLTLSATTANADLIDGIVDVWNVSVVGEFDCGTADFDAGPGVSNCAAGAMAWGTGDDGPSGLSISNLPPALIATNGPQGNNIQVTHSNNPLDGGSASLNSVQLASTLTLTPNDPAGLGIPPATVSFLINFEETPNGDNPCADGGANNVPGPNVNGCADIFVIGFEAFNFPFSYDLDGDGGPLESRDYFISFFEITNGLNPLSADACASAGAAAGCFGFLTPEGQSTTFQFASVITTEPISVVPAPASVALFGLALAALGWTGRRKRKI